MKISIIKLLSFYLSLICFSLLWAPRTEAAEFSIEANTLTEIKNFINDHSNDDRPYLLIKLNRNISAMENDHPLIVRSNVTVNLQGNNYKISGNNQRGSLFVVQNGGNLSIENTTIQDFKNDVGASINVNAGGALYVKKSTFQNNQASKGSAIFNAGSSVIFRTVFFNNTGLPLNPFHQGGAIYNEGRLAVHFSTFTKNAAMQGAAIYNTNPDSFLQIYRSTLIQNGYVNDTDNFERLGGGIYHNSAAQAGTINVFGSIIQENYASNESSDCEGHPVFNLGYNLISNDGSCNKDNSLLRENEDFIFAEDQATLKRSDFISGNKAGEGHFDLLSSSPAIDAGFNCEGEADQLGQNQSGFSCDIGAVEYHFQVQIPEPEVRIPSPRIPLDGQQGTDFRDYPIQLGNRGDVDVGVDPEYIDESDDTENTENYETSNPINTPPANNPFPIPEQNGGGCNMIGNSQVNFNHLSGLLLCLPLLFFTLLRNETIQKPLS